MEFSHILLNSYHVNRVSMDESFIVKLDKDVSEIIYCIGKTWGGIMK